jgi:hypothetical protein
LEKLKQYFEEYLTKVDVASHDILRAFMVHVEGRAKEDQAITLLRSLGYSLTPPPSPEKAVPVVTDVVHPA